MSLTHWYQYIRTTTNNLNMVTTNLCFTQLFTGNLKHDLSLTGFHLKPLEYYSPSDELFAIIYYSIWRSPTFLSTYCHSSLPVLICSLTKMHTQKWGNFEKTITMTSSHGQSLCFRTCLNNVNVSKWHFECDPHSSADLTQRSRLFICVETNSWCMLSSSIASPVFWVNSAQFFPGKSVSMKPSSPPFFSERNSCHPHLPIAHMPWEGAWHAKL